MNNISFTGFVIIGDNCKTNFNNLYYAKFPRESKYSTFSTRIISHPVSETQELIVFGRDAERIASFLKDNLQKIQLSKKWLQNLPLTIRAKSQEQVQRKFFAQSLQALFPDAPVLLDYNSLRDFIAKLKKPCGNKLSVSVLQQVLENAIEHTKI